MSAASFVLLSLAIAVTLNAYTINALIWTLPVQVKGTCYDCYSSFCSDDRKHGKSACDACLNKHKSDIDGPKCQNSKKDCYDKAKEWCDDAPKPKPAPAPTPISPSPTGPSPHHSPGPSTVPIYDGQIRDEGDGLSAAYMIIPPGGKDNHAATIEQLPDGSLVGAWFSGDHEEASNLAIAVSRLPYGKTQWTNATLLAKKEGYASQNPLLFYDNTTGKLHLFHTRAKADSGEGGAEIYHMYSKDGGVSWSDTEKYFENTGVFTRNAIIRRKDNGLLWPFYSTNGCKTSNGKCPMFAWTKSSSIPDSGSEWTQKIMDQGKDLEQPTCWRQPHDSSTIECYFRDCGQQHIYSAQSTDEGKSFSNPEKTSLPNPGSGIEGTPLTNGDLVLIFNPTTDDKRDPLSAGISTDDGKHWKSRKVQDGPTGAASAGSNEFAYPTVLQTPDGNIHVMYTYSPSGVSQAKTIKYIRFTEDWITKSSSLTYW